jgi:hypothetical protein
MPGRVKAKRPPKALKRSAKTARVGNDSFTLKICAAWGDARDRAALVGNTEEEERCNVLRHRLLELIDAATFD